MSTISPNFSLLTSISNSNLKPKTLSFNPNIVNVNFNLNLNFLNAPSPSSQFIKPISPIPKPLTLTASSITDTTTTTTTSLSSQSLKSRLHNGDTLYGLFLCSFSPTLAEIAGLAGYDFVVVDMEHGFGGLAEALPCLRALAATQTPAILRLPESTAAWAKKALDLGPQGIMFPMIESPKDAKKAVSYCRYPPNGVRGAAHPIVRASGYGIDAGYLSNCEEDLLIMCQVESKDAVDKVADIAAVEGVDCIQMGPTDLSASMGYLWDPGNKKVMEMMKKTEKAVLASLSEKSGDGAYLAGFAMPHDSPQQMKSRGYHMLSGAVDLGLFRTAVVEDVKKFKISLELGDDDDDDDDDPTADGKDADDKYWSE